MEGVRVENVVHFTPNLHNVAFVNVKFHLPGEFPLGYRIKVSLQKGGIAFGFDAAVEDAIISKELSNKFRIRRSAVSSWKGWSALRCKMCYLLHD